jgi:hypothetical protein
MSASTLVKKLLIKPGQHIAVIKAPLGYVHMLGELSAGVEVIEDGEEIPDQGLDVVQLFAHNKADVARLALTAIRALKQDGLLLVCYDKCME